MLASSREPCGGVRFPGRAMALPYKPSEYARPKGNGCHPPGVRRAGCPHPAAPCGGANVSILNRQCAVGVNARPTERGKCGGQPGNRGPALQQTPVGDDACIVRGPRGGVRFPGRAMALPYKPSEMPRQTGTGCNHPGDRRAGCPHPAALRGGANARGRDKSRPYDRRKARTLPGNRTFCGIANLCRGRCLHRPGNPAVA